MKIQELWQETIAPIQDSQSQGGKLTNQVWSCTFNQDGSQLLVTVGDAIIVYDTATGEIVIKPLRGGHQANIYCIGYSKDGRRFATGGQDKVVIIWRSNFEAEVRYSHKEAVTCIAFNPMTEELFSGGINDYILCIPEQQNLEKFQYPGNKILCCAWSPDGLVLAFGTQEGKLSFRNKKMEEKQETILKSQQPIWCMDWAPVTNDFKSTMLVIGCWDRTFQFYNQNGQKLSEKKIQFDPLSISYFSNGDFFVSSGTDCKISLMTRDGRFLHQVIQTEDWAWCVKTKNKKMIVACCCNDGNISLQQITPMIVHALYKDIYAYRDNICDIVVMNLSIDKKIRIKCKELIKKIALYKENLLVLLQDKYLIYKKNEITEEESMQDASQIDFNYTLNLKINKKIECLFLQITKFNIISCSDYKIQLMSFQGDVVREWIMESFIRYVKNIGGMQRKEALLIGLKNGNVLKLFIDNSFPILLIKQEVQIRSLDISQNKNKLVVVDENSNLSLYDLTTKETLHHEMNIQAAAFNSDFEDMLAYSGNGLLFIKAANFPPLAQKMSGFVVGFKGSKLFVLHYLAMTTIDVPFTSFLLKYIESKQFKQAYQLACLGSTIQDYRLLGLEALQNGEIEIAKKCFIKTKENQYSELALKAEKAIKNNTFNQIQLTSEVLAYQKKFEQAAQLLYKNGMGQQAVDFWQIIFNKRWIQRTLIKLDNIKNCQEEEKEKALEDKMVQWVENSNWILQQMLISTKKQNGNYCWVIGKMPLPFTQQQVNFINQQKYISKINIGKVLLMFADNWIKWIISKVQNNALNYLEKIKIITMHQKLE